MTTREALLRSILALENYITPGDQWRLKRIELDVRELIRTNEALSERCR